MRYVAEFRCQALSIATEFAFKRLGQCDCVARISPTVNKCFRSESMSELFMAGINTKKNDQEINIPAEKKTIEEER